MICLTQKSSVGSTNLTKQIYKSIVNPTDDIILILDKNDSLDILSNYGLDPDNLYANYTEIIEGTEGDYFYSLFFKSNGYVTVILPTKIAPATFTDTFYCTMQIEDVPDLGFEYMQVETALTDTYTPEQFEIYVELERLRESALANMQEAYFRMGYKTAVEEIYNEKLNGD